jgi:hypothetical protein
MSTYYDVGSYRVKITGQLFTEAASSGNPQFVLKFKVLERLEPANDNLQQYERKTYFTITDKTYERLLRLLQAIGFPGDKLVMLDPSTKGFHDFTGLELEMYCSHATDKSGKAFERWDTRRGESLKPLSSMSKIKHLDAQFARKPVNGQKAALAPVNALGITEDDVPSGIGDDEVPW